MEKISLPCFHVIVDKITPAFQLELIGNYFYSCQNRVLSADMRVIPITIMLEQPI
ncbi:hypothetical protein [Acinetobacter sp. RF14B]|uniref:hypothetical protein n=1 Tax=Acinetobacter sp. RF14B TaxID=2650965 RepID=UPI001D0DA901|nr:hypothetical protein [Acinetobacter sp. RF14B]